MTVDFSSPLLAIDTSTAYLSLALSANGHIYAVHQEVGNRQSTLILPMLNDLLHQANITAGDLAAIVYAQGPGAFTGLRIGLGVAEGLAFASDIPLIGIPCLQAVAALAGAQRAVLAATDARMGEVFYAWFDTEHNRRLTDDAVGKAADIALPNGIAVGEAFGIGNAFAAELYADVLPIAGTNAMPTAADYLRLAQSGAYPATAVEDAALLYVRNKVALTAAEQAARKHD